MIRSKKRNWNWTTDALTEEHRQSPWETKKHLNEKEMKDAQINKPQIVMMCKKVSDTTLDNIYQILGSKILLKQTRQ